MALRSSFTRVFGAVIPSAWANSIRDHLVTIATSDDVSSEGQLCVNTSTDQLVMHNGAGGAIEIARYGGLSSVTASTTQSFAVSATARGGMSRHGTWADAWLRLSFTSNGFTGAPIYIDTNLPAPSLEIRVGGFLYQDAGTALYEGSVFMTPGGRLAMYVHNTPYSLLGATPSFAIIAGDAIDLNLRWPVI